MELETDKAVVEVPSSVSGVVKEIKVKEGEKVKVGQVIFTLEGGATAGRAGASAKCVQWSMFPGSMARGWHSRRPFARKERPKSRRFRPTSRSKPLRHSACRLSWESRRHRTSAAGSGSAACQKARARNRGRHLRGEGKRTGRAHQ